jgi:hypothetical protein
LALTRPHVHSPLSLATSITVDNLEPSTSYQFLVQGIDSNGVIEPNGQIFSVQTASPTANLSDIVKNNAGVVGGVLAAVFALMLALVIGLFVYRRQTQAKSKKMIEEYASQLQMLTLGRGALPASFFGDVKAMDEALLRQNLSIPRTKMLGADGMTTITDVSTVQLPAMLLLDYSMDLRPEARLSSTGSAGAIFRGVLLQEDAILRNDGEVIAVKEMVEWPSLSDEDNTARFMQELSIMWALSFHPNIAKLIGYTESPKTMVTKLYPTDLFHYLHMQDDKEQLESHLLVHLASGIVAGLAAVHTVNVAHRDMNAPNILLAEPKEGNVFPDPVLADFGISRASEDNSRFESVNGYSPRYAAPEVISRILVKVRLRLVSPYIHTCTLCRD